MMRSLHPFDPAVMFPEFRLGIYRIIFYAQSPLKLPEYPGSIWHGVLGNALKSLNCPWEGGVCLSCEDLDLCAYGVLFEKGSEEPGFKTPPRPYIPRPLMLTENSPSVEMVLLGEATRFLPNILLGWEHAGMNGIGRRRERCVVAYILQYQPDGSWREIYSPEGPGILHREDWLLADYLDLSGRLSQSPPWKIEVLTPLRLRKDSKNIKSVDWGTAWEGFARRISLFNRLYHGGDRLQREKWDRFKTFLKNPGTIENQLRWYDWRRYSASQKQEVSMGGWIGNGFIQPPRGLEEVWWRWWQTAALLHIGKGATLGMGQIRMVIPTAHQET